MQSVSRYPQITATFVVGSNEVTEPTIGGDTLYVPCSDEYDCLPQKTYWLAKWAAEEQFDFLFKCDDDTFINVERLMILFDGDFQADYHGHLLEPGKYASGGAGYLLSSQAVNRLVDSSMLKSATGPEDMLVGKCLTESCIRLTHDARFAPWGNRVPAQWNNQITGHYVKPCEMLPLYRSQFLEISPYFQMVDGFSDYGTVGLNGYRGFNIDGKTAVEVPKAEGNAIPAGLVSAHASSWVEVNLFQELSVACFLDLAASGVETAIDLFVDGENIGEIHQAGEMSKSIALQAGRHRLEAKARGDNSRRYTVWSLQACNIVASLKQEWSGDGSS